MGVAERHMHPTYHSRRWGEEGDHSISQTIIKAGVSATRLSLTIPINESTTVINRSALIRESSFRVHCSGMQLYFYSGPMAPRIICITPIRHAFALYESSSTWLIESSQSEQVPGGDGTGRHPLRTVEGLAESATAVTGHRSVH